MYALKNRLQSARSKAAAAEEKRLLAAIAELEYEANQLPNTPMLALAKVNALILMNMQYERIMVEENLEEHPYPLTTNLVQQATRTVRAWHAIAFVEDAAKRELERKDAHMETKHHDLFQALWVRFSEEDYHERISRYVYRLQINNLADGLLDGMRCIDFGCGHGNFAHALVRCGAESVVGIDYGEESVRFATEAARRLGEPRVRFQTASVYDAPFDDATFDFAIQNGVFHHLDDEDRAIREIARIVKPGGYLWYYTDGEGAISHHLWDASVRILQEVPQQLIIDHLAALNLSVGKRYHLGDGLNATYRHTTWEEITSRLGRLGFGNFRRLVGGFPTDFDHDKIAEHRYGQEKFGSGDLRLLAQRVA